MPLAGLRGAALPLEKPQRSACFHVTLVAFYNLLFQCNFHPIVQYSVKVALTSLRRAASETTDQIYSADEGHEKQTEEVTNV